MSLQKLIEERNKKIVTTLEAYLRYCEEQNGLDHCKNCGLEERDLKSIRDYQNETVDLIIDGVVEMVEIKKKSRKWAEDKIQDGANKHKMFAKREGYNDALKDIISQLQTLKK